MDLRSLKKEVTSLAKIEDSLKKFQDNWIKTLRNTTNLHMPFLHELPQDKIKELNVRLATLRGHLRQIKEGSEIQEKLRLYCHYLIELKLSQIRENKWKQNKIVKAMLQDDVLKLSTTISQVDEFHKNVSHLSRQYKKIDSLLDRELSLEDSRNYASYPHRQHLGNLRGIARKQKLLIKKIGDHFITLAKKK